MILQIVVDSWILRVAWNTVDPYVHSICEETKELLFIPDTGFARQINAIVGIALLVSWAARSNIIAVRVLQQLITGRDGSAQDWKKVKRRLQRIEEQMKKELKRSQRCYCPESVDARLRSPFYLPNGTCYPKILSCKQKGKSGAPDPNSTVDVSSPTPDEYTIDSMMADDVMQLEKEQEAEAAVVDSSITSPPAAAHGNSECGTTEKISICLMGIEKTEKLQKKHNMTLKENKTMKEERAALLCLVGGGKSQQQKKPAMTRPPVHRRI